MREEGDYISAWEMASESESKDDDDDDNMCADATAHFRLIPIWPRYFSRKNCVITIHGSVGSTRELALYPQ